MEFIIWAASIYWTVKITVWFVREIDKANTPTKPDWYEP